MDFNPNVHKTGHNRFVTYFVVDQNVLFSKKLFYF